MTLISKFDPWHSQLCTCPPKLTFNPYTGCDHACVYCYASSYIPKFFDCRPKKNLILRLKREAAKLNGEIISISNSSDPYPNLEAKTGLMRKCLKILSRQNCRIQIITKSDLVVKDIDLLRKVPSMVSMTITTDDDTTAEIIEPHAPLPSKRLRAIETLVYRGVPVSVRIDPIIPFINDNPERLVETLASLGVKHITASTYKVRPDNWQRLSIVLPEISEKLKPFYFEKGEKRGGYLYLPRELRLQLLKKLYDLTEKYKLSLGTCREGLTFLDTAICDGSYLLEKTRKHYCL